MNLNLLLTAALLTSVVSANDLPNTQNQLEPTLQERALNFDQKNLWNIYKYEPVDLNFATFLLGQGVNTHSFIYAFKVYATLGMVDRMEQLLNENSADTLDEESADYALVSASAYNHTNIINKILSEYYHITTEGIDCAFEIALTEHRFDTAEYLFENFVSYHSYNVGANRNTMHKFLNVNHTRSIDLLLKTFKEFRTATTELDQE